MHPISFFTNVNIPQATLVKSQSINEQIEKEYGSWFCQGIGVKNLKNVHKVTAKELQEIGLDHAYQDLNFKLTVAAMDNLKRSAIRGIDGMNRPFLAISVEIRTISPDAKVTRMVELIFQPVQEDGSIDKKHYTTTRINLIHPYIEKDDKQVQAHLSAISLRSHMSKEDLKYVSALLKGQQIQRDYLKGVYIVKA